MNEVTSTIIVCVGLLFPFAFVVGCFITGFGKEKKTNEKPVLEKVE